MAGPKTSLWTMNHNRLANKSEVTKKSLLGQFLLKLSPSYFIHTVLSKHQDPANQPCIDDHSFSFHSYTTFQKGKTCEETPSAVDFIYVSNKSLKPKQVNWSWFFVFGPFQWRCPKYHNRREQQFVIPHFEAMLVKTKGKGNQLGLRTAKSRKKDPTSSKDIDGTIKVMGRENTKTYPTRAPRETFLLHSEASFLRPLSFKGYSTDEIYLTNRKAASTVDG